MNCLFKRSYIFKNVVELHSAQRLFSSAKSKMNASPSTENSLVHIEQQFESIPHIQRNKETFMAAVAMFKEKKSRSHVEFINSALKFLKEYGIHKDLETYKTLLNVFPKGKMIPQNNFQKIFLHFPMQQNCCVKVLDEMEWQGVQPDKEIHDIVVNAFGEWNFATKKVKRMLYWMPKLKHSNKYLDRRHIENGSLMPAELAGIALKMMCRDPGTTFSLFKLPEKGNESHPAWIASAQSPLQRKLMNELPRGSEVFVDGPFPVSVMEHHIQYVTMTCAPWKFVDAEFKKEEFEEDMSRWFSDWQQRTHERKLSVHEQKGETILALGAFYRNDNTTGTRWIEELQKTNPALSQLQPRLRLDKSDIW